MTSRVLALGLTVLTLTGCASALNTANRSTSTCPGIGPGACASPGSVYAITAGSLEDFEERVAGNVRANKIDVPAVLHDQRNGNGTLPGVLNTRNMSASDASGGVPPELALHSDSVTPVRMPSQVMRIRIFPWTDKHDNLHSGGYVYTEIEPRRWAFGVHEEGALRNARIPHRATQETALQGTSDDEAQGNREAAMQTVAPPVRPAASRNAPQTDLNTLTLE